MRGARPGPSQEARIARPGRLHATGDSSPKTVQEQQEPHVAAVLPVTPVTLFLTVQPPPPPEYPTDVRIYTKTGDDGTTGLLYGGRIQKDDPVVEAYGAVDETVAHLGLARALSNNQDVRAILLEVQRDLFVVGADLATNPGQRTKLRPEMSLVTGGMVEAMERTIDETVAEHPLPQEFIVPGANAVSAALDLGRTAARRAERRAVHLGEAANPEAVRYLNRLSDLLFVLARWEAGGPEEPSRRG
jgi:cob(I)alamin adenosyltransferase